MVGQARYRLMAEVWDGAVVVLRGRESRPHGEGRQRDFAGRDCNDVESPVNVGELWPDFDEARVRVRWMQTKLHVWATRDPGRVFKDLHNLVFDEAFLMHAWERVSQNRGGRTAGVDGVVPRSLPRNPVRFLTDIRDRVKDRTFRPLPV